MSITNRNGLPIDDATGALVVSGSAPIGPASGDLQGTYPGPTLAVARATLTANTFSGAQGITGALSCTTTLDAGSTLAGRIRVDATGVGLNGVVPVARAAAITTPTAPGTLYAQAEAQAMKTAVDAIRVALQNAGITL